MSENFPGSNLNFEFLMSSAKKFLLNINSILRGQFTIRNNDYLSMNFFIVSVPMDLDVKVKATLIGAMFLVVSIVFT